MYCPRTIAECLQTQRYLNPGKDWVLRTKIGRLQELMLRQLATRIQILVNEVRRLTPESLFGNPIPQKPASIRSFEGQNHIDLQ
jgi:hypothetical protein